MSAAEKVAGDQKERGRTARARVALWWSCRVLAGCCGAAVGLLIVRLLFRLLLANPANPVTGIVYAASRPLLFPWSHWWPPASLPVVSVERATVVAIGCYLLAGIALAFLTRHPARRHPVGVEKEESR